MAKRGNGKSPDVQIKLLTSIDEKLGTLIEGQQHLSAKVQDLTGRLDNMLEFLGEHHRTHERRLAAVEARLDRAGL